MNDGAYVFGENDKPPITPLGMAVYRALLTANQGPPEWLSQRFSPGGGSGNSRNFDLECGYPDESEMDANLYKRWYSRWGMAARCVDIWPDESWAAYPQVYETEEPQPTEFEDAWGELDRRVMACPYMHRGNRLSRIGQFGVLFLGLDDGGKLNDPPAGIDRYTGERIPGSPPPKYKLLYVRAFDQTLVRISGSEKNRNSPRYGRPTYYSVQFSSPSASGPGGVPDKNQPPPKDLPPPPENRVHWTRMIHLADNCTSSEVFGSPALRPVMNYLYDLRKVGGSSAEMFYKGGFPGYAFEQYPDQMADFDVDGTSLKQQIFGYQNGLQRYLATAGGKWNSLAVQVASPNNHLEWYTRLIATSLGVPVKTLMGTESGHLASTKDDDAWKARLGRYQNQYLTPLVVRPFIDRLVTFGCLPKPKKDYLVSWKDLKSLSDGDRAEIGLKRTQAYMQYVAGRVDQVVPKRIFHTLVMGFTEAEADAIEDELKLHPPAPEPVDPKVAGGQGGGGRTGLPQKAPGGRQPGTKPEGQPRGSRPSGGARRAMTFNSRRAAR